MMTNDRQFRMAWLVCGLAFLLRFALWMAQGSQLNGDVDAYLEIGRNLAAGEGFSKDVPAHATAYRPPLLPLVLALIFRLGGSPWILGGLHVVLGTLTTLLTLRVGSLLQLPCARFLAAALVAMDPVLVQYTSLPMTETLCAFLVAVWMWIRLEFPVSASPGKIRLRNALWEGVALGLLSLCRPAFLAGAGLILVLDFARSGLLSPLSEPSRGRAFPGLLRFLTTVAGMSLLLLPWTVRNGVVIGKFTPATTHGGYTFLLANNTVFYREVLQKPWGTAWALESLLRWQKGLEDELSLAGIQPFQEVARDRWMYSKANQEIQATPDLFWQACLWRAVRFWDVAPWGRQGNGGPFLIWSVALFYSMVLFGLVIGITNLRQDGRFDGWVFLILVLALWLTHWFFWTDMRMRAPIVPILALYSARGWFTVLSRKTAKDCV